MLYYLFIIESFPDKIAVACCRLLVEILVIGTGNELVPLSNDLVSMFRQMGVQTEVMPSRRACATYNVLVEEDRRVGAALIPLIPTSARELNSKETDEEDRQQDSAQ